MYILIEYAICQLWKEWMDIMFTRYIHTPTHRNFPLLEESQSSISIPYLSQFFLTLGLYVHYVYGWYSNYYCLLLKLF